MRYILFNTAVFFIMDVYRILGCRCGEGVGSSAEGRAGGDHGTRGRRAEERLLERRIRSVTLALSVFFYR